MEKEEILNKAIERLKSMKFEKDFYSAICTKTKDFRYAMKIERLNADILELEEEIKLFKGGE